MKVVQCDIPEVLVFEPRVFGDDRGFFLESFNQQQFNDAVGREVVFVQDNHSCSSKGVLRGLHYQIQNPQGKLVRVVAGEIFDVAVDIRRGSATFGKWVGLRLSAADKRQIWVPAGFAHGFLVLSETAEVLYKTTDYYFPNYERSIAWDDPTLKIDWPITGAPTLSAKDAKGCLFAEAEVYQDSKKVA
ncbi:MAG: dTDP-4-dehydrorhamnose 3,5-epimerase [Pseudomonadota bacterium]|jgi:dTDP-4-dehydrorhamnose 3,5-epimerase